MAKRSSNSKVDVTKQVYAHKNLIILVFIISLLVPIFRAAELSVLAKLFWILSVFVLAYFGWKLKGNQVEYKCLLFIALVLAFLSCLVYFIEHLNTEPDSLQFLEKAALLSVLFFIGNTLVLSLGYFVNMSKKK